MQRRRGKLGGRAQMGISGLLPLLRSITKRVHIEALAGEAVAIDAYSWLHKGVFLCSADLFHERPTNGYVDYCMARIRMLKQYNIRPIMVFDGAPLPMKALKEASRLKSREESKIKAHSLLKDGDSNAARVHMHKSIDVTPEMAYILIQELKRCGIEYVVAPYEADAQMAFLDNIGAVSAIVTEDSDMILFGCRRILYKLDKNGFADEITLDRLGHNTDIELSDFNLPKFRQMCILSGCDYLDSISGFGLKTCHKYFLKYKTADRVLQAIRAEFPGKVPEDFERNFKMAELTFAHQRVYDMRSKECVHLNPLDEDWVLSEEAAQFDNWDFVGPHLDPAVAYQLAIGELNPMTKIPFTTSPDERLNTSQDSFTSEEPPVKVVRSRFFQAQSKGADSCLPARLTLKSNHASVLENKENEPVKQAASARHFGTHASKSKPVSKAFNTNPSSRDYLKSNVPAYLFPQKRPLAVSKKPLRLNPAQPTLFDYAKQKKESK